MIRYEYKVEKKCFEENMEDYLNRKAQEGWRCISVMVKKVMVLEIYVVLERPIEER